MKWLLIVVTLNGSAEVLPQDSKEACQRKMLGIVAATMEELQKNMTDEQFRYANSIIAVDCIQTLGE